MMTISSQIILPLIALATCAFAVYRAIHFQKRSRSLSERLQETTGNLENMQHDLQTLRQKYSQSLEFNQNLSEAAVTTRLQRTRLALQTCPETLSAPERYRYVHRLAGNGMAAEEIASVLCISSHEARQLVTLAQLAGNR